MDCLRPLALKIFLSELQIFLKLKNRFKDDMFCVAIKAKHTQFLSKFETINSLSNFEDSSISFQTNHFFIVFSEPCITFD